MVAYPEITHVYATPSWSRKNTLIDRDKRVHDPVNRRTTTAKVTFGVNRGLTKHLTGGAWIPWVQHSYKIPGGRTGRLQGVGDGTIYLRHALYKYNERGGTSFESSLFGGARLPTGRHGYRDRGSRLPDGLQPGRSAVDTMLGLAAQYEWSLYGVRLRTLQTWKPTGAHHLNKGNDFSAELQFKYRYLHQPFPQPGGNARVSVKYTKIEADRKRGRRLANSGGEIWTCKVGFVHHQTPQSDVNVFVSFPLAFKLRGTQLVQDRKVDLEIGWRF